MQPCGHASENPARQISLFCIPRLTIADDTRIAPIGGSSRAYHVVCIPTVMDRPKQHGVPGLHIYTEHAVPRPLAHAAIRYVRLDRPGRQSTSTRPATQPVWQVGAKRACAVLP
jgi:hypothetical protein